MSELRECPYCKSSDVKCDTSEWPTRCLCRRCDMEGPLKSTEAKAVAAWNSLPRDNQCTVATAPEEWRKNVFFYDDGWREAYYRSGHWCPEFSGPERLPPDTILTLIPPPREVPS